MIILIVVAFLALLLYSVLIFKPKNFPPGKSYAVEERLASMCTNGYIYFKLFVYLCIYEYFNGLLRNWTHNGSKKGEIHRRKDPDVTEHLLNLRYKHRFIVVILWWDLTDAAELLLYTYILTPGTPLNITHSTVLPSSFRTKVVGPRGQKLCLGARKHG
jgi:hypothetical protein